MRWRFFASATSRWLGSPQWHHLDRVFCRVPGRDQLSQSLFHKRSTNVPLSLQALDEEQPAIDASAHL